MISKQTYLHQTITQFQCSHAIHQHALCMITWSGFGRLKVLNLIQRLCSCHMNLLVDWWIHFTNMFYHRHIRVMLF